MTVLLTDDDSTIAVRGGWFICANTGEIVMRSETCSSRFAFTICTVTLSGSHILIILTHTHTPHTTQHHTLSVPVSFNYNTNKHGNTKYTAKLWATQGILGDIT